MFEIIWNQLKMCNNAKELKAVMNNVNLYDGSLTLEQITKINNFYVALLNAFKMI